MRYSLQIQGSEIGDSVRARYSMCIPILSGMLFSTNQAMVQALGGFHKITFEQFCRIYQEHDGDYGICFEYAVHRAIERRDRTVYPLISNVLEDFCKVPGGAESILFGAEKSGATSVISSAADILTDDSVVLAGRRGAPPKLKGHLDQIVKAFRSKKERQALPPSIRGIWKADLFVGSPEPDKWVATTLKTNRRDLEPADGLRIGMYPEERPGKGPERDRSSNLILCPLPYSSDFMQLFGATFQIIQHLVASNGKQPKRAALVYEDDQQVAKWLCERRGYPVWEIIEALEAIKQPDLMTFDGILDAIITDLLAGREPRRDLWEALVALAPIPLSPK